MATSATSARASTKQAESATVTRPPLASGVNNGLRCSCSSFAKEHLQRLQQRQPDLTGKELELADATALGIDIIATPMLLLFQNQQLLYAGPLATDFMCSDNASVLEGIISGLTVLPGFWLNGESTACRCRAN